MREPRFFAIPAQREVVAELSDWTPANPFATHAYCEFMGGGGRTVLVLGVRRAAEGLEFGCLASLRPGKLHRRLEIPSLPSVGQGSPFWAGLQVLCHQRRITKLELCTFGSLPKIQIPRIGGRRVCRSRTEFIVELAGYSPSQLSSNHRRNVKKAQKAGVTVKWERSAEAVLTHHALINQSFERRRFRGERVASVGAADQHSALLDSGAGDLCQAFLGGTVLSSILVLRAAKGAYYHSAGTSPEGMSNGASQFLIHTVAHQLSQEGLDVFNLGGADEGTGLARFKEGFGVLRVNLPSASCCLGPRWRHGLGKLVALLRH